MVETGPAPHKEFIAMAAPQGGLSTRRRRRWGRASRSRDGTRAGSSAVFHGVETAGELRHYPRAVQAASHRRSRPADRRKGSDFLDSEQRYWFDVQGYLVLKNVLSPAVVKTFNDVLDRYETMAPADFPAPLAYGRERDANSMYLSNVVEADPCFHPLIDQPAVLPIVKEVSLGLFRLNHTYALYHWGGAHTRPHMAGTPLHPKATYTCKNGEIFSLLTKAVYPLLNHGVDDGCFAVIPGSHKANFPVPKGLDAIQENLVPIPADPGDAIVFTEALTHGSWINRSGRPRRTVYFCYSVGYMPDWTKYKLHFSEDLFARVSDAQREVLRLKVD
jgi:ectoine hydroxylase-related dioxygenase (phytanoyl-CoA dioxygenase family)